MLVLGPAETSMHVAAMLGHRFSIVTIGGNAASQLERMATVYGLAAKLASVRAVDIPVLELESDPHRLVSQLVEQSTAAVREDGAHVIVFGCTGMAGYAEAVRAGLAPGGHRRRPGARPDAGRRARRAGARRARAVTQQTQPSHPAAEATSSASKTCPDSETPAT